MPCARSSPGATASIIFVTLSPERYTTIAPAMQPKRMPPHTPRPPFQTSKMPFHFGSGTSPQLVMSWYRRAPTIPNATPQTATRKMRSQSPPRCTQRTPVSATQAAMASRSISPYMWSTSGPMSIVPVCGEGIEAITRRILP